MIVSLAAGDVFAGRYEVVRCIAAGGMGAVYEVVHLETERHRALKVLLPHLVQSPELRELFKREARVAAQIESEFIVDVFDAGVDEATGMPFMVMELLKGEELGKRLTRLGRFPAAEALTYLHQVSLALEKTHGANIVHRDLKPENVFLTKREHGAPRIKVLDFGIAKLTAVGATQGVTTRMVGTPLYMAPEQFRRGQKVSPASDIYALGMMAYTLLVGVAYWEDEASADSNVFAFAATAMHGPKEPASERARRVGVELPASFDAWFAVVTSTVIEDRFPTAPAAVAALARALGLQLPATLSSAPGPELPEAGELATAPTVSGSRTTGELSLSQELPEPRRGRLVRALAWGTLGAVVLGGGGLLVARLRGTNERVETHVTIGPAPRVASPGSAASATGTPATVAPAGEPLPAASPAPRAPATSSALPPAAPRTASAGRAPRPLATTAAGTSAAPPPSPPPPSLAPVPEAPPTYSRD